MNANGTKTSHPLIRRRRPQTASDYLSPRADYDAAKASRFRRSLQGVQPMGSGADYHFKSEADYLRLMEQARDFDRNDPIVGQGITRLIRNVLQRGVTLDPATGNDEADALIKTRWKGWSGDPDQCDVARRRDLHTIAGLTLRSVIVDGDITHLGLKKGSLQSVEAHRLRTPRGKEKEIVHGIRLSETREAKEFWFTRDAISPRDEMRRSMNDFIVYKARDARGHRQVFHVLNPKRLSQTRGITALAPIANTIGMHTDLQFAQLLKAQIAACWAILEEVDPDAVPSGAVAELGERVVESYAAGGQRTIEGISPGMIHRGEPGVKLTGFSPNVPNQEFFPHVMLVMTFVAVNLGIPVQVLLLDPSKTNFSGWRGAIDQARGGFRDIQDWMIAQFYRPIFLWKLRQWIATDAALGRFFAQIGDELFRHEWTAPSWPYIEPSKDAAADTTIIKSGLDSRRGVLNRRGLDIDLIDRQRIDDGKRLVLWAIEAAGEINAEHADAAVDWRELAGFDPKGRIRESPQRSQSDPRDGTTQNTT